MLIKKHLLFNGLLLVLIVSCRPDPTIDYYGDYSPTPVDLDIPDYFITDLGQPEIPEDNPMTEQGIELGRKLFYDPILSRDETVSCATCHLQSNSFSDPDQTSEGVDGLTGTRNSMSISNLMWNTQLFWDARRTTLEDQAYDPVRNPIEMDNNWTEVVDRLSHHPDYPRLFYQAFGVKEIDSSHVVKAIAQFERTLLTYDSPYDRYFYLGDSTAMTASQVNGMNLFFGETKCFVCHNGPLMRRNLLKNNGLDATTIDPGYGGVTGLSTDMGLFKIPTLRNIEYTAPYMHDGRFATLEEVIDFYNEGVEDTSPNLSMQMTHFAVGLGLTASEKTDLVNFLKALSDPSYLTNPEFSAPE